MLSKDPKVSKKKIAVCYFGPTRSTKKVYLSHFKHLFNVLDKENVEFDVFMHTWYIGEYHRIWETMTNIRVDYDEYKLLDPTYFVIDNQDELLSTIDISEYFYENDYIVYGDHSCGEWRPGLIRNHICALESQKRVTEMVYNSGRNYDLIMYIRPDVLLKNTLPIKDILLISDNDIVIPNFDHNEGYNDRFAVLTYRSASLYGKRIDHLAEFRKREGRIVSEKYVKYICLKII